MKTFRKLSLFICIVWSLTSSAQPLATDDSNHATASEHFQQRARKRYIIGAGAVVVILVTVTAARRRRKNRK